MSRLSPDMYKKVVATLATRYDVTTAVVKKWFSGNSDVLQFGKVTRLCGGDTMHAHELVECGKQCRDASFVRVCSRCVSIFHLTRSFSIINFLTRMHVIGEWPSTLRSTRFMVNSSPFLLSRCKSHLRSPKPYYWPPFRVLSSRVRLPPAT